LRPRPTQGVFGFLICIAGFLSIKVTSPISHMISAGALRLTWIVPRRDPS